MCIYIKCILGQPPEGGWLFRHRCQGLSCLVPPRHAVLARNERVTSKAEMFLLFIHKPPYNEFITRAEDSGSVKGNASAGLPQPVIHAHHLLPVPTPSPVGPGAWSGAAQAQVRGSRDQNILGFTAASTRSRREDRQTRIWFFRSILVFLPLLSQVPDLGQKQKKLQYIFQRKKAEVLFSYWTGNKNALEAQNSKNSLNILFSWLFSSEFIFYVLLWYVNSTQCWFGAFIWSFLP